MKPSKSMFGRVPSILLFTSMLFFSLLCWVIVRDYQHTKTEVQVSREGGVMGQISLAFQNYGIDHKAPLPRVVTTSDGKSYSWRVVIAAYLDSGCLPLSSMSPQQIVEANQIPEKSPASLKIPNDKGISSWTSILAIYDKDNEMRQDNQCSERTVVPWPIIALPKTGIFWSEPLDMTVEEFKKFLSKRSYDSQPVRFINCAGQVGTISGNSGIYVNTHDADTLVKYLFAVP